MQLVALTSIDFFNQFHDGKNITISGNIRLTNNNSQEQQNKITTVKQQTTHSKKEQQFSRTKQKTQRIVNKKLHSYISFYQGTQHIGKI